MLSFARTLAKLSLGAPSAQPAQPGVAALPPHRSAAHPQRDAAHGAPGRERERDLEPSDASDPTWAHRTALLAPPLAEHAAAHEHVDSMLRHGAVFELAPQLLRKMAWSGDGKRGAARLELGSGSLSGAVVTLESNGREVELSVEGLTAREESSLRERLSEGLSARGFRLIG